MTDRPTSNDSVVRQSVCPIAFDCRLVEEAVFLAVRSRTTHGQSVPGYQRERDQIYDVQDDRVREARFRACHGAWFVRFGLHQPVEWTLDERFSRSTGLDRCQVVPAVSPGDEMADLGTLAETRIKEVSQDRKILIVRLRPESLLTADALVAFLRHEFLHVADMLDPTFGYERALPVADAGPSHGNLVRSRYRVLWDATIDGRLVREGAIDRRVRDARLTEFARAFAIPPDLAAAPFTRWFDGPRPRHQDLMSFASRGLQRAS